MLICAETFPRLHLRLYNRKGESNQSAVSVRYNWYTLTVSRMILTIEEQSYDRFYIVQSYIVFCRFHIFSTFSSFIQLTQFLKYDFLPHWKIFPDMNVIKIYELKKKSPYHKILIFILLLRNVLMKYTCLLFFWCNVFHLSFFFSYFLFSLFKPDAQLLGATEWLGVHEWDIYSRFLFIDIHGAFEFDFELRIWI